MKKIYILPNVITAFGLLCGLFVIFKLNLTPSHEVSYELLLQSTGILLLAGLADLLDGAVARVIKAESDFGGFFDSMSDAITFGVAPAIIVLKSLNLSPGSDPTFWLTSSAMVFAMCGVLRLVRYNVQSQLAKNDPILTLNQSKHFTGLPIPSSAAALISMNLFLHSPERASLFNLSPTTSFYILSFVMFILGYFMVSRWKFPSLKTLHVKVTSFRVIFLTVVSAVLIFYGILHHFSVVFLVVSWGYIVAAWILAIIRLIAGRKSKTLEEFEPDNEDDEPF